MNVIELEQRCGGVICCEQALAAARTEDEAITVYDSAERQSSHTLPI